MRANIPCTHCKQRRAWQPGNLCNKCYQSREIRLLHPAKQQYRPNKIKFDMEVPKDPQTPCDAKAGSEEKIKEMTQRVERGEKIFHPDDNLYR